MQHRHLSPWRIVAIGLLALVCLVTGASPSRAAEGEELPAGETAPVDVLLTEYAFTPDEIVVEQGTVRLRILNAGIRRHNLVVLYAGQEYASPHLRPGEQTEWTLQIDEPGRYRVWCNEYVHLEKGMVAVLVVR